MVVTLPLSVANCVDILPFIADLQPTGPLYPAGQGSRPPVPLPDPGYQQCGRKSPPRTQSVKHSGRRLLNEARTLLIPPTPGRKVSSLRSARATE